MPADSKRLPRSQEVKGSAEIWLNAAYEYLVDYGIDSVRIGPIAAQLRLSRTSFYWFFKDREALLAALLETWRNKNTGNLVKQTNAYAESITEAILNIFDCWLNSALFDSRLEFSVRSWAQQSDAVSQEIRSADATRIDALTQMFIKFGIESHPADVHARTLYLTQIGYISMKTKETLHDRMARIPEYVEIFTGIKPQERELLRFYSRHGFSPQAESLNRGTGTIRQIRNRTSQKR